MTALPPRGGLDQVHRVGAAVLGAGLCLFGLLGCLNHVGFFAVHGAKVLGLSSNGLLSTISLVVGAVLIGAALRGGRISSTITAVVGVLFLLSGLVNLAVLDTGLNLLAFRIPNVIFSFVAGMLLLFLGAYGRFSGGLSADNPYYRSRHPDEPTVDVPGQRSDEQDAENERWIAAELAVAEGRATPEQERLVHEDQRRRAAEAHRRAWELYERQQSNRLP